ncbi:unnamed protein product [Alopecurus aequalis]
MAGWPDLWNQWAIQILVLLSFTVQVFLLVFAGVRRRRSSWVLRLMLWLAYQLADSTAIYALGLLSHNGLPREHQLAAFWAPFLLIHLGGPDNITAYSLEDSKLWQRHLLTVIVQVLAAGYVLYKHMAGSGDLVVAAILMFVVGVVKYAERIWALKCSDMDSIRSSLNKSPGSNYTILSGVKENFDLDDQVLLEAAHSMFHFCKLKLVDSSVKMDHPHRVISPLGWKNTWRLIEMELSLLYDILYTKAAVIHTWPGYCIRFMTPLVTVGAFLLFHLSNGLDGQSGVDVTITYALLGGALFIEVTALLRAIGSTGTLAFLLALHRRWSWLRHALVCTGRWRRLRRLLLSLGLLGITTRRRWSGNIGQYNLLHFCSRDSSRPLSRLAEILGLRERWNKWHYSRTLVVSEKVKELVYTQHDKLMSRSSHVNALGLLRTKWGKSVIDANKLYADYFKDRDHLLGVELQEGILIWHIATEVFLANRVHQDTAATHDVVAAIKPLSDYMMFLLVTRPDLLPGLVLHRVYQLTCENLVKISSKFTKKDNLAVILYTKKGTLNFNSSELRVHYGVQVAEELIQVEKAERTNQLGVLLDVWMDFLSYAANRCSRESYTKSLNNGGELIAILWLMAAHFEPDNQASRQEDDE